MQFIPMKYPLYILGFLALFLAVGILQPTLCRAMTASVSARTGESRLDSRRENRPTRSGCREAIMLEDITEQEEADSRRNAGPFFWTELLWIAAALLAVPRRCHIFRLPDSHFLRSQYIPHPFQGRAPPIWKLN